MNKKDLKTGMIVETRGGDKALVMLDNIYGEDAIIFAKDNWTGLNDFSKDLLWRVNDRTDFCKTVDIVKIYRTDLPTGFLSRKNKFSDGLTLLWERKEEAPEYVECIKSDYSNTTVHMIYKVNGATRTNYIYTDNEGKKDQLYARENFKPSTKEAFDNQTLLDEVKKRYTVGSYIEILVGRHAGAKSNYALSAEFVIENGDVINKSTYATVTVYSKGKWAEIIEEPNEIDTIKVKLDEALELASELYDQLKELKK